MNRPISKLDQQAQQQAAQQQVAQSQPGQEFATVEEMLRFDAAQTPVPPEVEERLRKSVEAEPRPAGPWWRRWLGR